MRAVEVGRGAPPASLLTGWARAAVAATAVSLCACSHLSQPSTQRSPETSQSSAAAQPPDTPNSSPPPVSSGEVSPSPPVFAADIRRLEDTIVAVAERVAASVVSLRVESWRLRRRLPLPFFGPFGPRGEWDQSWSIARGVGSGVIVRSDGYVLTNHHVIHRANRIEAQLHDGRVLTGEVVGRDRATDLAVIHLDATDLPAARFADPESIQVGQWVVAVGAPFGLSYTVTAGVISAVGRGGIGANEIEDYLQTDASINPGNSGGPLVNLQGEVVGINTMVVGRGTGIGFAIPSSLASNVAEQIIGTGEVRRSWIGVSYQRLTPELAERLGAPDSAGALVSDVVAEGPAAAAGVLPGDIIVSVNGERLEEGADLLRSLLRTGVGEVVRLGVLRDGNPLSLEVTTAQRPEDDEPALPTRRPPEWTAGGLAGADVASITPAQGTGLGYAPDGGVLVRRVTPGSPADRAGLRPGDVIVEADRRPARRPENLRAALRDGSALVRVLRRDGAFFTLWTSNR